MAALYDDAPRAPTAYDAPARLGVAAGSETVRIFERDPDLLAGQPDDVVDLLRRRVVVPMLRVEEGPWTPPTDVEPDALGLLVVGGLLLRTVQLDGRDCPELIGAGDLLRPWDQVDDLFSLPHTTSWRVLQPIEIAVLDARFAGVVSRFPSLVGALLARSVERNRTMSLSWAIAHVRLAETRLLMLFWHLADRWGRVTPDGILVPLPLTHELLAHLTCMRRPTASTALQELARSGELQRQDGGGWLLTGSPLGGVPAV